MSPASKKFVFREGALPPITIEVQGKEYPLRPINRRIWRELKKIEERVKAGEIEALHDQLILLTEIPVEIVDELEFREIRAFVEWITTAMFAPPLAGLSEVEKNGSEAGRTTLPS